MKYDFLEMYRQQWEEGVTRLSYPGWLEEKLDLALLGLDDRSVEWVLHNNPKKVTHRLLETRCDAVIGDKVDVISKDKYASVNDVTLVNFIGDFAYVRLSNGCLYEIPEVIEIKKV